MYVCSMYQEGPLRFQLTRQTGRQEAGRQTGGLREMEIDQIDQIDNRYLCRLPAAPAAAAAAPILNKLLNLSLSPPVVAVHVQVRTEATRVPGPIHTFL